MSNVEVIEGIFVAHTKTIDAVKSCYPSEQGMIDRKQMPMVTMLFLLPQGVEAETGDVEEVDYSWIVYLYVSLVDWNQAQRQMKQVACDIVTNFRQHRGDYANASGYDFLARGLTRREEPTPMGSSESPGPEFLRGSWTLKVTAGEGDVL